MKNFVLALLAVIAFTACKAEDPAPDSAPSLTKLYDMSEVEFVAIGRLSSGSMTKWKSHFLSTHMVGSLPELGESLVITRCDDGDKVQYCSTINKSGE